MRLLVITHVNAIRQKKSTAPQQATTIKQQTNLRPPTSDESEKPEARHKGIILIRGARARREHHLEKDS